MNDLQPRVITALIGGIIFLALIYLGGYYAMGLAFALLTLSGLEIAQIMGKPLPRALVYASSLVVLLIASLQNAFFPTLFFPILISIILWKKGTNRFWASLFAVYLPYAYFLFYYYSSKQFSLFPVLAVIATVWSIDIVAYFVGLTAGSRKIFPRVSPGKTLEGTLSGILTGIVVFAAVSHYFLNMNYILSLAGGAVISLAAVAGDLLESAFKRTFGVKDSGYLLPGHGGVLDRFDSLVAALIAFELFLIIT